MRLHARFHPAALMRELAVEHDDALGAALDEEFRELLLAPQRLPRRACSKYVEMHHDRARRAADDEAAPP